MREVLLTELIDALLGYLHNWDQHSDRYMEQLQRVVDGHSLSGFSADREETLRRLKEQLQPEDWSQLPELVEERQSTGEPVSLSSAAVARRKAKADRRIVAAAALKEERAAEKAKRQAAQDKARCEEARLKAERRAAVAAARRQAELARREAEEEARRESARIKAEREAAEAEVQRRAEEARREARAALLTALYQKFEEDFFSAERYWAANGGTQILPAEEYEGERAKFIRDWALHELGEDFALDAEQACAVGTLGGDVQVVARAGSGKTRTLVARALFLQKHCGVAADELLLLAFNRDAAKEMRRRLRAATEGDVPHVMTFHALAYALAPPRRNERLLADGDDDIDDFDGEKLERSQKRVIRGIVRDHLQSEVYSPVIRRLMLLQFRQDWGRIIAEGLDLPLKELVKYRRHLTNKTIRGEYVRSFTEKLIANTLLEHGVEYRYRPLRRFGKKRFDPDFMVLAGPNTGLVIECCGPNGSDDYDDMIGEKRKYWAAQEGWQMVELSPCDGTEPGIQALIAALLSQLGNADIKTHAMDEDRLWEILRVRGGAEQDFTNAMTSFVGRCRKLNLSADELQNRVFAHQTIDKSERLFLDVACSVYSHYLRRIERDGLLDFDGLLWRAIAAVRDGRDTFEREGRKGELSRLRFVLVDEFQDFSEMFYELSGAIRERNARIQFFCVGDDWQAINAFAGSDLRYFRRFGDYFQSVRTVEISTNYRSAATVVRIGNDLMAGLGKPASPGSRATGSALYAYIGEFEPSLSERERARSASDQVPALLRLVKYFRDQGQGVVLLSRINAVQGFAQPKELAKHVRAFFPEEDHEFISASSMHKYKGREQEAVIVLGANDGLCPLIHSAWVFTRIFGTTLAQIEEEERRLFYVALTRAERSLVVLSDELKRESPYLKDIRGAGFLSKLDWSTLPLLPPMGDQLAFIRVHFPYDEDRNGRVRAAGYEFDWDGRYYFRSVPAPEASLRDIWDEPWAEPGIMRIALHSEDGELLEESTGA